jgi:Zn-dependent M28 family amino/carboxypeptidase
MLFVVCSNNNTINDSEAITSEEIKTIVSYLASDEIKGRITGSEGIDTSASFIENYFKKSGVKPYYKTYRDHYITNSINAFNIIGVLEGNDPILKKELVILGAHYDHIGEGKLITKYGGRLTDSDSIANGANDNASGTATVLTLAKHFSQTKRNKRTLIFTLFSGEEMGLKGSKYLAERFKSENLNLYAMVNFEMLGVPFLDNRAYDVFISGYDLSNMAGKMNDYIGKNVVGRSEEAVKYNLFRASDNYPFYEAFKLPCQTISSCDLTNYKYYHHVDDEADQLDYKHMANVVNKMILAIEGISNSATKEIKMNDE